LLACLSFLGILMGCSLSLDDKYHYTISHRIENKTKNSLSGTLIVGTQVIYFDIEAGKTNELYTRDGGDGSNVSPPKVYEVLDVKELHLDVKDTSVIIDVEPDRKWVCTIDKSTVIFTFPITEDLLTP